MTTGPKPEGLETRFWKKVQVAGLDDCWEWTAHKNRCGYGRIGIPRDKSLLAHRASYLIHFGEIPNGKLVIHSCDNPGCVNPNHLRLGTHRDNTQDMLRKQRGRWDRERTATTAEAKTG